MDGGARLAAARWVIRLGRVQQVLLLLSAAGSLLMAAALWSVWPLVLAAVTGGLAAGWGAVVQAFAAHRYGAWQLMLALAALGVAWPLLGGRSLPALAGALLDAALLCLLLHADSRDWVDQRVIARIGVSRARLGCRARRDAP